jgi:hypothetical protein
VRENKFFKNSNEDQFRSGKGMAEAGLVIKKCFVSIGTSYQKADKYLGIGGDKRQHFDTQAHRAVGGATGRGRPGQPVLIIRTIVLHRKCSVKPDSGIGGRKEDGERPISQILESIEQPHNNPLTRIHLTNPANQHRINSEIESKWLLAFKVA